MSQTLATTIDMLPEQSLSVAAMGRANLAGMVEELEKHGAEIIPFAWID